MTTPKFKTVRRKLALLLAGLALLGGCAKELQAEGSTPASVSPEPPTQTESAPSSTPESDTPAPASPELPTPTESTPSPTPAETAPTPEELLAQQPIDETHNAFLVDTGGQMGTLVITMELAEQEDSGFPDATISVWDPKNSDKPIQTISDQLDSWVFGTAGVVDANFDGYMDFWYLYFRGNQPAYSHYWLWDENAGQFVNEPEFDQISCPEIDTETEIISGYSRNGLAGLAGTHTFHRWIDGALVCVRKVETNSEDGSAEHVILTVEEPVDGTLTEVYRRTADAGTIFDEAEKWFDLSYHGEP